MTKRPAPRSLIDAIQSGAIAMVREFLEAGTDPDSADSMGRSALYHAASRGDKQIVKMLLEKKADANMEDDDGETPFIAALAQSRFDIAAMLLEAGAGLDSSSGRQGQTPLHWAFNMDLKEEKIDRVIWLLGKGANPGCPNASGRSVLARARDYERQFPFAGEMLGHMEEFIKTHDPAYIRVQEMQRMQAELCAALRDGLPDDVVVRRVRLNLRPPRA